MSLLHKLVFCFDVQLFFHYYNRAVCSSKNNTLRIENFFLVFSLCQGHHGLVAINSIFKWCDFDFFKYHTFRLKLWPIIPHSAIFEFFLCSLKFQISPLRSLPSQENNRPKFACTKFRLWMTQRRSWTAGLKTQKETHSSKLGIQNNKTWSARDANQLPRTCSHWGFRDMQGRNLQIAPTFRYT